MYIEQLSIFLYQRDWNNWHNLSEEERWKYDEPIKPLVLIEEEEEFDDEQRQIVSPDILG